MNRKNFPLGTVVRGYAYGGKRVDLAVTLRTPQYTTTCMTANGVAELLVSNSLDFVRQTTNREHNEFLKTARRLSHEHGLRLTTGSVVMVHIPFEGSESREIPLSGIVLRHHHDGSIDIAALDDRVVSHTIELVEVFPDFVLKPFQLDMANRIRRNHGITS